MTSSRTRSLLRATDALAPAILARIRRRRLRLAPAFRARVRLAPAFLAQARLAPAFLALTLFACADDGLVPAEREPDVQYRIEGRITNADALPPSLEDVPVHPLVVWIGDRDAGLADGAITARAELPDRLTILVHRPPPAHVHFVSTDGERSWAIARLLLYAALDTERRWDPERDPIVGGTDDLLLLHVPGPRPVRLADGQVVSGMALVRPAACAGDATLALRLHGDETPRFRVDPETPFPVLDFALDCAR